MRNPKDLTKRINERGFTLIEMMISMGLLTFVMAISMNVLSLVLDMTNDADYSVVVTQEANYASERVKRLIRSAESFSVTGDVLTINLEGKTYTLSFDGPDAAGDYVLRESDVSSVMSSEICVKPLEIGGTFTPFYEEVYDSSGLNVVGVRMAFKLYHQHDDNQSAGAFVYTQAIGRNVILN